MKHITRGSLLLLLLGIFTTALAQDRPIIMIDPGHGGEEAGVVTEELVEKGLVLRASYVLADVLVERGYDVRLTRTGDYAVSIPDRRAAAESAGAALFLSLHMNQDEDPQKHGIEIYTNLEDKAAANAAEQVAASLRKLNTPVVVEGRPWGFLKSPTVPSMMIEAGFLTHPVERRFLVSSTYYRELATKIADGADAALGK